MPEIPKIPLAQRLLKAGISDREFPGAYRLYTEEYFQALAEIGREEGGFPLKKALLDLKERAGWYSCMYGFDEIEPDEEEPGFDSAGYEFDEAGFEFKKIDIPMVETASRINEFYREKRKTKAALLYQMLVKPFALIYGKGAIR